MSNIHTRTHYSYEIRYNAHKHIETTERGLVIVAAHESDSGRYDCHLGGSLLCSYVITVDAHRYENGYECPKETLSL